MGRLDETPIVERQSFEAEPPVSGSGQVKLPELPKYRSHKQVGALKIHSITPGRVDGGGPGATLISGKPYVPLISVSEEWMHKHDPQEGGYWVRYEDGYESYSPAKAFEDGYTLIGSEPEPQIETGPKIPPYGEKRGRLTQFGSTWIGLDNMNIIEFDPTPYDDSQEIPANVGASIGFVGTEADWRISRADASALRAYLEDTGNKAAIEPKKTTEEPHGFVVDGL